MRDYLSTVKFIRPSLIVPVVALLVAGFTQRVAPPPAGTAVTAKVVAAANAFLATLSDADRAKVTFDFASNQRSVWSNLPSGIYQRNGLRLGDLTQAQRQ